MDVLARAGKADDVAGGVDVGHGGLERVVDFEFSARIRLEGSGFQTKRVSIGLTSHAVEERARLNFLAAFEFGEDAVAGGVESDARDLFTETKRRAHLPKVIGERLDDFAIDEIEDRGTLIDESDFRAESGEEGGVLETDDARTDDDQFLRDAVDAGNLIGIDDVLAVEGNVRAVRRARAASDQKMAGPQERFLAVVYDFDCVRIDKLREALKDCDVVALELRVNHFRFARDDRLYPRREFLDGNIAIRVVAVDALHGRAGELKDRFAHGLARDRARVDAHAAHHQGAVDDGDALAHFCRANRAFLPGRTAADHNEIKLWFCHASPGAKLRAAPYRN
jgi:hypothetical protein